MRRRGDELWRFGESGERIRSGEGRLIRRENCSFDQRTKRTGEWNFVDIIREGKDENRR